MSATAIVRVSRSVVIVSAIAAVVASIAVLVAGRGGAWVSDFGAIGVLPAVFFAVFVWLVVVQQPRNRVVWIMTACSGLAGVFTALTATTILTVEPAIVDVVLRTPYLPADLPRHAAWIRMFSDPLGTLAFMTWLTYGLLLFPDGTLPSPRLRWLGWLSAAGLLLTTVGFAWITRPWSRIPVESGLFFDTGLVILSFAMAASATTLGIRLRRSDGSRRQQLKWVLWGASVFVPAVIVSIVLGGSEYDGLAIAGFAIGEVVALTSYGIAVGRYRLYDIDVVISRTVVYGALALFIGVVYVALVVGIGSWIGAGNEPNTALAIGATAIVALGFQPVRQRMERVANRLVFGRRATPYEVLSDFSRRVAATGDTVLADAARSLVEGTRAERAEISVAVDGRMVEAASWPESGAGEAMEGTGFPIEHEGKELGRLELFVAAGQRLLDDDLRLAGQLASGMGLALRNQLLTRRLEARVDELRDSRRRLVAVQDETRRRLERDLHDGAQQQLVALKVKLGLARTMAGKDGANTTLGVLEGLTNQADSVVETMREFARGVYPPLLEAEGLPTAIGAHARRAPIPVSVESDGIGRYDREVESAVYFCVTEALQNAARHANASHAEVSLAQNNGTLRFEIRDDGDGFDPTTANRGMGIVYMTDRAEALSGTVTVTSTPEVGTVVVGAIPAETTA